jgi:uncharacterized hydrophobic protein (TIGR00271 family)
VADNDGHLSADQLPASVASLAVAPFLVRAGVTQHVADQLEYIVDQVYFIGAEQRERLIRFAVLIVLSTMIATFGLVADSVAVVIGAMLVAPLMTPILGMAVSIVLTESRRLVTSGLTVLGGAAGAILVAFLISVFAAGSLTATSLPGEVMSRTSPGLVDLGIAVAAGLTGGYLLVDQKAAASAAGVAIAVALVPPLATVGICASVGAWADSLGALLLFSTNFVAIVLSASAVIVVARIVPAGFLRARFRELRLGFAATFAAVVVVAIPLGIHTANVIQQETFTRLVTSTVGEWDPRSVIVGLSTSTQDVWTVSLQVRAPADRSPTWLLAQMLRDRSGHPVDLDLRYATEVRDRASAR